MEIVQPTPQNIARAANILREGGIVAHATETCYGLACDLGNLKAVGRLFALKKRPENMPVSALFESIEQAKLFTEWSDLAEQLANAHLPGPLTIVVPLRRESGLFPTPSGGETIGIRISPHPVAMALAAAFGSPVSTTSANLHGEQNTYSPKEIADRFSGERMVPDLVLDSGNLEKSSSSSVLRIIGENLEILRHGPLKL